LLLTKKQLAMAKGILKHAYDVVREMESLFHNAGDAAAAERLKDIAEAILNELEYVNRLLAGQS
jgi:hypothetical protein